jgi:hypothetical protein
MAQFNLPEPVDPRNFEGTNGVNLKIQRLGLAARVQRTQPRRGHMRRLEAAASPHHEIRAVSQHAGLTHRVRRAIAE